MSKRKYCQDEICSGVKIPKNREAIFIEYANEVLNKHDGIPDNFNNIYDMSIDEIDNLLEKYYDHTEFDMGKDTFCIRKDFLDMNCNEIYSKLETCDYIPCAFCEGCIIE